MIDDLDRHQACPVGHIPYYPIMINNRKLKIILKPLLFFIGQLISERSERAERF